MENTHVLNSGSWDLSLNRQAAMVLEVLRGRDIEIPAGWFVSTYAWYNGRERGFQVHVYRGGGEMRVIAVSEHRNSDNIAIDQWEQQYGLNPPTAEDFPEEAYRNRRTLIEFGDYEDAADTVESLILGYIESKRIEMTAAKAPQ